MNGSLNTAVLLKRIQRDYLELKNYPVKGIGIFQLNGNDPYFYIVNLKILTGCYEGLILHLALKIPSRYPIDPPKATIFSGQGFSHNYHHHIYPGYVDGNLNFCIDLLENHFGMNTKAIGTGWTSAYTFKAICLQLQNFLSDPDMRIPSKESIEELFKINKSYSKMYTFDKITIFHTYDKPYPEIYGFEEKTDPKQVLKLQTQEKLTCFFTKTNPLIDSNITIGYPIDIRLDFKGRIEPFPIPEIVSYTGYTAEGIVGKNILNLSLKTAYGQKYNFWLPIYVNENHYKISRNILFKSIAILKSKDVNSSEKDFQSGFITEVFPAILCKMIVFLLNGTRHNSISAIEAFCHYILLFQKMIDENKLSDKINKYVESVSKAMWYDLHKKELPDNGNFIILLFFSKFRNLDNKALIDNFFNEYLARQIYWLFVANDKSALESGSETNRTKLMRYFIDDPNVFKKYQHEITKNTKSLRFNLNNLENKLLEKKNFFNELFYKFKKNEGKKFQFFQFLKQITIVELIFEDQNEQTIFNDTKNLYYSYLSLKEQIFRIENYDFNTIVEKNYLYPLKLLMMCTETSKKNILRQIFELAKVSNQLLIFIFLTSKTFINQEFLEKLSNNYGVIDTDEAEEFISKVEILKKKIDTYDKMFEHLGLNQMIKNDICENFFKACCLSNLQNYTRLVIPYEILDTYNFKILK